MTDDSINKQGTKIAIINMFNILKKVEKDMNI